jgi:hypothetical protein
MKLMTIEELRDAINFHHLTRRCWIKKAHNAASYGVLMGSNTKVEDFSQKRHLWMSKSNGSADEQDILK